MTPRRVNDAQVERLLSAMKGDPKYRTQLAARLVAKEGVKKFTSSGKVTAEYARRYKSTMRRLQRYVTEAGEKRSFARAPVDYQREVRQEARRLPPPLPRRVEPPPPPEYEPRRTPPPRRDFEPGPFDDEDEGDEDDSGLGRDIADYNEHELQRAVVAYYDGDVDGAGSGLSLSKRGTDLLSLATEGEGADISGMPGSGEVTDALIDLIERLPGADLNDIRDFHDLLMDFAPWEKGMILADLADGYTTFADWMDRWRENNLSYEDMLNDPAFWKLWRAAYERSKA